MTLEAGTLLSDRYRVERWLARGGFAEVYEVRHVHLDTRHALKVLRESSPTLLHRLRAEGRVQAELRHPNFVRVTDLLDIPDVGLALVMDFVDGPSLTSHLESGPVPPALAHRWGQGLMAALARAHQAGLVHRDIKPDNILLEETPDGLIPRITDFGLAHVRSIEGGGRHTRQGMGMGTPGYMAPEQFVDASNVDQRADIFALGAVLFEMVTGRPAFDGESVPAMFRQVTTGDRPAVDLLVPELPMGMVEAIESALEPEVSLRAESCSQLLEMWNLDAPDSAVREPPRPALSGAVGRRSSHTMSDWMGDDLSADAPLPAEPEAPVSRPVSSPQSFGEPSRPSRSSAPRVPEPPVEPPPAQPPAHEAIPSVGSAGEQPTHRWTPKKLATAVGALMVGPLLAGVHALDSVDVWLNGQLANTIHGTIPSRRTAVVELPDTGDIRGYRKRYPELLTRLADAGAASITFDLSFSSADDADAAFADAVETLTSRNIPVIAAGRWLDGKMQPPGTPELKEALSLGLATVETEGWQEVTFGRVPAHVFEPESGQDRWAISVLTVQSWTPRIPGPFFDDRTQTLEVGGTAHPAENARFLLHAVGLPPVLAIDRPEDWPDLTGRAVVVGAASDQDRFLSRLGIQYGVYLQAAAIESLAAGRLPRPMSTLESVVTAGLAGALGIGILAGFRERWAVAAGLVVIWPWVMARVAAGLMVPVSPLLAALLVVAVVVPVEPRTSR